MEPQKIAKKRVRKAGAFLAAGESENPRYDEALDTVNVWRFVHIEMLREALDVLDSACGNSFSPILVGRIKRLDTIVDKLRANPKHNLDRLGDISGARLIVRDDDEVRRLTRVIEGFEGRDIRVINDYIKHPKDNGYRGIHLSYRRDLDRYGLKNMLTEIQVRSQKQHLWATSVELFDTVSGIGLKRGRASSDYVRYFRVVSDLMGEPLDDSKALREELKALEDRLHVLERLRATAGSMYAMDDGATGICRDNLCVILADFAFQTIELEVYDSDHADAAVRRYAQLEEGDSPGIYLLARASSAEDLRIAYPNYYANSNEFCNWLGELLS